MVQAFSILKNIFGEGGLNLYIPKFDGMVGAIHYYHFHYLDMFMF